MRHLQGSAAAVMFLAITLSPGCGDSGGVLVSGEARLRVHLTDAPADYVDSALVSISRVILIGRPDDDATIQPIDDVETGGGNQRLDLLPPDQSPKVYDLMELQDGIQALLADSMVPAGVYDRLLLVVDEATVTLAEGVSFVDGSTTSTLHVPSGMQNGIKVRLDEPIVAEDGTFTLVVVDFDVNENFVLQGNPETPAGLHSISFTPVLHELSRTTDQP